MAGEEVQSWFKQLPMKLRRELAAELQRIAEDLAADIRAAAPEGKTGKLKQSITVKRGRGTLEFVVSAGGAMTTKTVGKRGYVRPVRIGADDTQGVAKGNQGVLYDYVVGQEYGNSHQPAKPFFFSTYRAKRQQIEAKLQDAVAKAVAKL